MSEFVMVSCELLERCIKANDEPQPSKLYAELRAVLAQEAGKVGPVDYLDIGADGYMDLGSDLSERELSKIPCGRHDLVIAGVNVPDGWKLVPIEPTREMLNRTPMHPDLARSLYSALLADSPDHVGANQITPKELVFPNQEWGSPYADGWNACLDKVKELNQ